MAIIIFNVRMTKSKILIFFSLTLFNMNIFYKFCIKIIFLKDYFIINLY